MKLILASTIDYCFEQEQTKRLIQKAKKIVLLPLAMPMEMDNNDEWASFYGSGGQLRDIYETPFSRVQKPIEWLNIFTMEPDVIKAKVEASDCVILLGGDANALVTRLKRYQIETVFTGRAKTIIGISAGAKIWFSRMFVEYEDDNREIHLELTKGIGYFPTNQVVAVHVDFSDMQLRRMAALLEQETIDEIIAIGDRGLLMYDTETETLELAGAIKILQ